MTLLTPSYELVLGSEQWTEQALGLDLELHAVPLLDVLHVRLPAAAPLSASVGDDAKLTLDGGEGAAEVFSGSITAIRRVLSEIVVTALDAGGDLARYRPAVTYEQATAATVVRSLCGDVGVDVDQLEDGVSLAYYAADPSRTALDHVGRVCGWSGALARVTAQGKLESFVVNAMEAEFALKYARDLLEFERGETAAPIAGFVAAGESGAGSTSAPEALRPTTDFFAGSRPEGPSSERIWHFEPALRTAQAAQRASAALGLRYDAGRRAGRMETLLKPQLRPGSVVELQDLPDKLAVGSVCLTSVRHRLSPERATTSSRFREAGGDLGGLLGSLGGLV